MNQKIKKQQREESASTFFVQALLDYLRGIGVNLSEMFEPTLLSRMSTHGTRVPISLWLMMFERAIALTNDPNLALKVAEQIQPKYLGMFGFAAMSSQSLRDIFILLMRYEQIIDDVNLTKLIENGNRAEVHWYPVYQPTSPIFMQQSLVSMVIFSRWLTSNPSLQFDAYFSFKQPEQIDIYQRIFGGQIFFDAEVTKLVFDHSLLNLPISHYDLETHKLLVAQVEKSLQAINQPSFLQKLHEYLSTHLANNLISIEQSAHALGMSSRTMQYALHSSGITYRHVLDQVRREYAEHYLSNTNFSLSEIAFLLGYSEQSPFQSAFKRWTGVSPGEFRKKAQMSKTL
ncbi:AraC family transcriptional regulator [Aquirhabdus sp.]|uniref:AraC family transcriptional regulator n=1 Tax=Aquirhabdus sp. TaxID=2824160 RepID=UPI00396CBBEC